MPNPVKIKMLKTVTPKGGSTPWGQGMKIDTTQEELKAREVPADAYEDITPRPASTPSTQTASKPSTPASKDNSAKP